MTNDFKTLSAQTIADRHGALDKCNCLAAHVDTNVVYVMDIDHVDTVGILRSNLRCRGTPRHAVPP